MVLTQEEEVFMKRQEQEVTLATTKANLYESNAAQQTMDIQQQESNMIKDQLSLNEELDMIEHLLRGEVLKDIGNGIRDWSKPDDLSTVILTEHGIYLIMNTIMFYLNKNTLLSNYTENTINEKMEDFAEALNDTMFMEYEKIFVQPTLEQCKEVLMSRIKRKTDLRKFALELVGKEFNEEDIEEGFIKELEDRIDVEIDKIREQLVKNKLKRFNLLMRQIQDAVHSTYLRAFGGQERRTLRQHWHISENRTNSILPGKGGKGNVLNYG